MTGLETSDIHRLNAALGWLGLDRPEEARDELDAIAITSQDHPAILEVRWTLCIHEGDWKGALATAEREIAAHPENSSGWLHRAYALRRVEGGGLIPAWDALLPAAEKFPKEPVIAYNLSCYACQLNRLDLSRTWLQRAMETGKKRAIKKMAMTDDDLRPLWSEISKL